MSNTVELKPCPFCGGEPIWDYPIVNVHRNSKVCVKIKCVTCKSSSNLFPCEDNYGNDIMVCAEMQAAKSWNRRM